MTIVAHDHDPRAFSDEAYATAVTRSIVTAHQLRACRVLAYCLMPDHLHLVTVVGPGGDLVKLIDGLKSFTTRQWWDAGNTGPLWQVSFHDRGLRETADMEQAIRYVWENPERAGIVDPGSAYLHRGGEMVGRV